jgi:hypothetical protein
LGLGFSFGFGFGVGGRIFLINSKRFLFSFFFFCRDFFFLTSCNQWKKDRELWMGSKFQKVEIY